MIKDIIEGWLREISKGLMTNEQKILAEKRIEICVDCQYFTKVKTCSKCGCFMPAKTKSTKSKCPLNKW